MVNMVLFAKRKWRHRGREPICEYQEGKGRSGKNWKIWNYIHTLLV